MKSLVPRVFCSRETITLSLTSWTKTETKRVSEREASGTQTAPRPTSPWPWKRQASLGNVRYFWSYVSSCGCRFVHIWMASGLTASDTLCLDYYLPRPCGSTTRAGKLSTILRRRGRRPEHCHMHITYESKEPLVTSALFQFKSSIPSFGSMYRANLSRLSTPSCMREVNIEGFKDNSFPTLFFTSDIDHE